MRTFADATPERPVPVVVQLDGRLVVDPREPESHADYVSANDFAAWLQLRWAEFRRERGR